MKTNYASLKNTGALALLILLFCARPASAQPSVTVETNQIYGQAVDYTGSNVDLELDAYYVAGGQTNRPVMILTHGGGFGAGDKGYTTAQGNFYPDMATAFATNGYAAFSLNYRLWPGCPGGCTDEIAMAEEDVMTALNWIQTNSVHYGIDTNRIVIGGDSAGGGLAVNVSYLNLRSFLACISLWGGVPPYGTVVHPVNLSAVTSETPPTCFIHGTADTIVPYAISVDLSSNLTAAGVYNELHPLPGDNHYPVMVNGIYQTNLVSLIIRTMVTFANLEVGGKATAAPVHLGGKYLHAANGHFIFDLNGPTNFTVAVEQSNDHMNSWQPVETDQLLNGAVLVTNTATNITQVFRARVISQ